MAKIGNVVVKVKSKNGKAKSTVCPMTQDQYIQAARRECVVVPGISPAYAAWVSKRAGRA